MLPSGWLLVKAGGGQAWRRRWAVLSEEAVLSFYAVEPDETAESRSTSTVANWHLPAPTERLWHLDLAHGATASKLDGSRHFELVSGGEHVSGEADEHFFLLAQNLICKLNYLISTQA